MSDKNCGECCGFSESENRCLLLGGRGIAYADNEACRRFSEKKPIQKPTNGDKIMQGGNRALAEFHGKLACDVCAYRYDHRCNAPQGKPLTCVDGIEAYLNAPAKEGEDE